VKYRLSENSEKNMGGHMNQPRKRKSTIKSSCSGQMAPSLMPKGILEIGKALIKELALEPGDDTLCRWMAHYIAELIEGAEAATEADRPEKLAKCSEIILALWQHRSELPNGKRPFEEFEPIFRAIESLDPDDDTPRYYRLNFRSSMTGPKALKSKRSFKRHGPEVALLVVTRPVSGP